MGNEETQKRSRSKEYPAYTLDESIEFIKQFKDYPHNRPISYAVAAKQIGVSSSTKSFAYRLSSAKQFGLITTSSGALTITKTGMEFLFPTKNEKEINQIKRDCFKTPAIYKELLEEYNGRPIPSEDILKNVLVQSYGILASVSQKAASVFIESAQEAKTVLSGVLNTEIEENEEDNKPVNYEMETETEKEENFENKATEITNNEYKVCNSNETLVIPIGNKKKAILEVPSEMTEKEAKFVGAMIQETLKQLYYEE